MQFFKFNVLLLLLITTSFGSDMFTDMECINGNFDSVVEHKAAPFGLSKNILVITKNECHIEIVHEKLKFMKNNWSIDICRGPVHIKKKSGGVEVIKRGNGCKEGSSPFCKELKVIQKILQDDGLIFASGQKENISNEHGKVFCSFLLVNKYLRDGFVFTRGSEYEDVLQGSSRKSISTKKINIESEDEQIPEDDGPGDF